MRLAAAALSLPFSGAIALTVELADRFVSELRGLDVGPLVFFFTPAFAVDFAGAVVFDTATVFLATAVLPLGEAAATTGLEDLGPVDETFLAAAAADRPALAVRDGGDFDAVDLPLDPFFDFVALPLAAEAVGFLGAAVLREAELVAALAAFTFLPSAFFFIARDRFKVKFNSGKHPCTAGRYPAFWAEY